MAASEPDKFAEAGIQFSRIPPERSGEVLDFLYENFFPEEPLSRSLGVGERHWLLDYHWGSVVKAGHSVMATNQAGKIIGVRCAEVVSRNNWGKWAQDIIVPRVAWIFDSTLGRASTVIEVLNKQLGYNIWAMFNQLQCDKIFAALCLCSAKDSVAKGLGTELLIHSEALAREEGCYATSVMVTGLYSGKIFRRAEYDIVKEIFYADFKDENGELYLKDTRQHLSCLKAVKIL